MCVSLPIAPCLLGLNHPINVEVSSGFTSYSGRLTGGSLHGPNVFFVLSIQRTLFAFLVRAVRLLAKVLVVTDGGATNIAEFGAASASDFVATVRLDGTLMAFRTFSDFG